MTLSDHTADAPDPLLQLDKVKADLREALNEAGASSQPPHIIAVSKTHPAERIEPLLAGGHRMFGENRVQEAAQKWPPLREKFPDLELHLIGPLQSNKTKDAVGLFDVIQTIDREKIARAIAAEIQKQGRAPGLFVQINTGEEEQKAGVAPQAADLFIKQCQDEFDLALAGVMCIPPLDQAPAPHFALLAKIAERNGLPGVSMGMSGDYRIAAQLGASHVRVGSAIFGARAAR
ncbi:MAG: YggS family pyridoxal phosphate-dependent enzyme [Pseudomonadota bacterium]